MANAYIFTLQPTFTQGFLLGQLSILCLLVFILKSLFFDTTDSGQPYKPVSYHPRVVTAEDGDESSDSIESIKLPPDVLSRSSQGSMDWLNVILQEVLNSYRMKLCDNRLGSEGEEIARRRVEEFANRLRPASLFDPIRVHSVNLGVSAPRLSEPRHKRTESESSERRVDFTLDYVDTVSISFSTSVLLNYPFASFGRLPVSLTISLSLFSSSISLVPPEPGTTNPAFTFLLPSPQTDFVLDLKTTSLMGSRAKLADVPKLHELIREQIRKVIINNFPKSIPLPGLASVAKHEENIIKHLNDG